MNSTAVAIVEIIGMALAASTIVVTWVFWWLGTKL